MYLLALNIVENFGISNKQITHVLKAISCNSVYKYKSSNRYKAKINLRFILCFNTKVTATTYTKSVSEVNQSNLITRILFCKF